MAHSRSAKKRVRQTIKRTLRNRSRKTRIRTFVRRAEEAIAAGDPEAARAAFVKAESELRKGVGKGVLHMNTAARKISRLARRVKMLTRPEGAGA